MLLRGRSVRIFVPGNRGTTSRAAPHGGATLTAAVTGLPRSVLLSLPLRDDRSSESSPVMAGSMLVPPLYARPRPGWRPRAGDPAVAPTLYSRGMARSPESPATPRVSPPDLPPHLDAASARRGADLLAASLELTGTVDLAHSSLEQCTIAADADAVDLTGATLIDVDLGGVRIASLRMRDASIRRVRIGGGRIGTLDLSGARIDELLLGQVRIDYLNLGGAKATDVEIERCDIRTVDMPQAELTRVRFSDTRSDEVDPRGMRATHTDLRGLDAGAFLDANSLRGTTLSGFQVQQLAPLLAAGIGIQVKD